MKFKGRLTGDYSPETKTLRIEGRTTAGVQSKVEIPMESPVSFFLFLGALFTEAEDPANPVTTDVIPMRSLNMGIARDKTSGAARAVIFDVSVGGFHVKFGAPVEHLETSTIQTIETKLADLSLLMAQTESSSRN
jgi:hypothetical protein